MGNQQSQKEREVLDNLLNFYLKPTVKILNKDKMLTPMGASMGEDGEMTLVGMVPDDEDKVLAMNEHLRAYRQLLRSKKESIACLLGYDVRLKDNSGYEDAISIEIETKSGYRALLIAPYKFKGVLKKKLEMADIRRLPPVAADKIYI